MSTKHTPGPWKCDKHGVITGGTDLCDSICETYRRRWAVPEGLGAFVDQLSRNELVSQNDANGRLIAAAPELLEALRELELRTRQFIAGELVAFPASLLPAVRAIIANATGE